MHSIPLIESTKDMSLRYNSFYNRCNHSILSRAKILSELIKKLLHREARNRISAIDRLWSDIIPNREISARENDRRVISARIIRICSGRRAPWGAANATRHKCQYICGGQYITIVVRERAAASVLLPLSLFRDQHGLTNTRDVPMNFNRVYIRTVTLTRNSPTKLPSH